MDAVTQVNGVTSTNKKKDNNDTKENLWYVNI